MSRESIIEKLKELVEIKLPEFHNKRLRTLEELKITQLTSRKNPYLYKAKGVEDAYQIVKGYVDYFLASQEETLFGNLLEELAIYVCKLAYGGQKSGAEGIDLEFERDGIRYFVSVKSGPNWGNSQQIKRMVDNFKQVGKILPSYVKAVFVEGCCYGRCGIQNKGFYYRYCGKDFWELISGVESMYIDIIEPLGYRAKERSDAFLEKYNQSLNRLVREFTQLFCRDDGSIDWEKLLAFTCTKNYTIRPRRRK